MTDFLFSVIAIFLLALSGSSAVADQGSQLIKDGPNRICSGDGDYLVILHGWTTGYDNMREARAYFSRAGYHVVGLRYPVRTTNPTRLLKDYIRPGIAKHCTDPNKRIHFLTHSLGALLLREYLKTDRPENLGRVVMLAPPNNGIELVDRLADRRSFGRFFGPTALELGTGEGSWAKRLGKADFPVGIVMGSTRRKVPFTSKILPGTDDGIVSLESGRLDGMKQMIQITGFHTSLPVRKLSLEQARHFIEHGEFSEEAPAPTKGSVANLLRRLQDRRR